ncbi:MAG: hypothetical protein NC328_07640 [Muribaculum sp.]|nr:hypothetical protein [Muribaculum sp.]
MKKFLLSLLAVASIFTMAAQSFSPSAGVVNTSDDAGSNYAPGGLGTFTVTASGITINRDGIGYATLKYNNEIVAQIAPSNTRRVQCIEGFTSHLESGNELQIQFWTGSNADNPYRKNGSYQLIMPSGFYTVNGKPNNPYTLNFTINDAAAATKYYSVTLSPSAGDVNTLSEVTLTFNGLNGATVNSLSANNSSIYFTSPYEGEYKEYKDEDGDSNIVSKVWQGNKVYPKVSISENQITLKLDKPFTEKTSNAASLNIDDDAITVETSEGSQKYEGSFTYKINGEASSEAGDLTITPAPATYEGGIPAFEFTNNASSFSYGKTNAYAIWGITVPENAEIKSIRGLMMPNTKAYVADAEGKNVSTTSYAAITYKLGKDNKSIYFVNNSFVNGSSAWGSDIPMALNPGTYYFVVPAGAFTYAIGNDVFSNEEIKWGPFVITAPQTVPEYTIVPASGSELKEIKDITISFSESDVVNFNVYNRYATLKNGAILIDLEGSVNGSVITFSTPSAITTPGTYTLEIAGADLKVNNVMVPITAEYTIVPSNLESITFDINGQLKDATKVTEDDQTYFKADLDINAGDPMFVQLILPVGYDAIYYVDTEAGIGGDSPELLVATRSIPVEGLVGEGWKLADDNKIPVKYGINSLGIAYAVGNEATEYSLLMLNVNKVGEEPGSDILPLEGTMTGTVTQESNEFPYTIAYKITYNADKTLTINAKYTWTNGTPVGLVAGSVYVPSTNVFNSFTDNDGTLTATTTDTFEPNDVVELQFYRPMANGVASHNFKIQIPLTSGVEGIAVEEGEAVYYNVNGVRVANPENGLYIKVINGKASKVVVK